MTDQTHETRELAIDDPVVLQRLGRIILAARARRARRENATEVEGPQSSQRMMT